MGPELLQRYTVGMTISRNPSLLPITLYHSAWRTAADALVWTIIALPLLLSTVFKPLFWTPPCFVLVTCYAARLWWRAFDRSLQMRVDERGIWIKGHGQVEWADMREAGILPGRHPILAITLRDKQPWLARAGWLARTIHEKYPARPFRIAQPLLHLGVDYPALGGVLKKRFPAFSPYAAGA